MATTTLGSTPGKMTDRRSLYWGIIIAVVLAVAVILTVQATSNRDTVTAPETATGMSNTATTPVQRTDVPPMEATPENSTETNMNRAPTQDINGPAGPGPQRSDSAQPASP